MVALGTLVWLGRHAPLDARRYARALTWSAILLTVGGNATFHGLLASKVLPPWWLAVVLGAVPPAALGAVVHLAVLVGRTDLVPGSTDEPAPVEIPTTNGELSFDRGLPNDQIVASIREWVGRGGSPPTWAVLRHHGIGTPRAQKIMEAVRNGHGGDQR